MIKKETLLITVTKNDDDRLVVQVNALAIFGPEPAICLFKLLI